MSAILNRAERGGLRLSDIEHILGMPIRCTLPSDPGAIRKALQNGIPVSGRSDLGRQIEAIARGIGGELAPSQGEIKRPRRFIEYFSISHARQQGRAR